MQIRCLHSLIDPSFHGINRFFVLSFKDEIDRESHK